MAESRNTQIIRDAWDQYQGDHLKFNIKDRPDFYAFFEKGVPISARRRWNWPAMSPASTCWIPAAPLTHGSRCPGPISGRRSRAATSRHRPSRTPRRRLGGSARTSPSSWLTRRHWSRSMMRLRICCTRPTSSGWKISRRRRGHGTACCGQGADCRCGNRTH